jgi:hypothetical protein
LDLMGLGDCRCNTVIQEGMSTTAAQLRSVPKSFLGREASSPCGAAQALARVQAFAKDHRMRWKGMPGGFADFEKGLHERVMGYERELLAEEMAAADIDAEAIEVEGTGHRRVLRCEETYMTAAGPVRVMRSLYKDHTDEASRAIVPLELRIGVVEGFWTPLAAQQAAWVVSQMVPKLGEELFARMGNMTPSKSTLDRLPKALSERWEADRQHFEQAVREGDVVPREAASVAISLDGVLVPTKDGDGPAKRALMADEGRLAQGPVGYREVGCGTLSFCDADGEMISAIRIGRMPEPNKATLKRTLLADLMAALDRRPDLRIVKLADAALDNWTFLSNDVPDGPQIVDFFHAAEHLNAAVAAAYGDGTTEARRRFADLRFVLREEPDGVEHVIRSLAYLHKKFPSRSRIEKELKYFRKNRKRMRYQEFANEGLPIGSGVVEAACKTLAAQRMKLSGMRWGDEGGQAILTLRGWSQSADRFDRAWALLAATYRAEVITLHNVVPIHAARARNPRR